MDKIAFFVISTELGGAEKSLLDFLKEFKKKSPSIIVFTPKNTGPLLTELDLLNIDHQTLRLPKFYLSLSRKRVFKTLLLLFPAVLYSFYYLLKIQKKISAHKVKTLHSTGIKFHILLLILSIFNSDKRFHIHIRDIISSSFLKAFFYFFKNNKNINFIFNSKATAESLSQIKPLVIYNGFDKDRFSPGSSSLKSDLNIPNQAPLVAIVGVIARWKGQREFLKMAERISTLSPEAHFLIVGDEIYDTLGEEGELSQIKSLTQELQLQNRVHFLGFHKDIEYVYRGIDILAHCSITPEPFGRVIVEAMLCGCPVVASNKGGPLEIITHNDTGLLYELANTESLISAISSLLTHENIRNKISLEARKKALQFSLESYSHALSEQLLDS